MSGYSAIIAFFLLLTSAGGDGKRVDSSANYVDSLKIVNDTLAAQGDSIKALIIKVEKTDSL